MNSTYFALMAEFGSGTIELSEICEKYFGLKKHRARIMANRHQLPIPVFRAVDSQKSPLLVNIADLAEHLDKMHARAKQEYLEINCSSSTPPI